MDSEFTIKEATIEDVDLAIKFRTLLFEDMGADNDEFIENLDEELHKKYKEEYKNDKIRHFIAYDKENKPVAIAGGLIKSDFPYYLFKPGYYGWIIDVYTKSEFRGKGISTKLLKKTHDWLKSKGVYESKLIAAGANPRKLYERLGYRATWEMSLNLSDHKTYNELIDESSSYQYQNDEI